jgi:hypothetical protein
LQSLKVQNIPDSPELTVVYLADMRDLIVKGMGRCVVVIEQRSLSDNVGGMLVTSHDTELDWKAWSIPRSLLRKIYNP